MVFDAFITTELSMRRRRRTTEHEKGLEKSAAISYHSFDGQPSFSLGTDVVDPLTMSLLSSAKSLGLVLCTREAHLFSEQALRTQRLQQPEACRALLHPVCDEDVSVTLGLRVAV